MKHRIVFLLHIPPPVHGSSMVGQWIQQSKKVNSVFDCHYINLLASKNVNESGKVSLSKLIDFAGTVRDLIKVLVQQKPEVVYMALTTTGAAFYRDILLVFILKLLKVKRVYHLHNKGIARASKNRINYLLYKYVFRNATVIVLSEQLKEDLKGVVETNQIEICANGIPATSDIADSSSTTGATQILFLSNLIEEKGIIVFLLALSFLKQRNISFQTTIIGGEGDISSDELQHRISELYLFSDVKYVGKKFNSEKENILNISDLFVFPTYYQKECFPLVLLEAMQHALPVISTFEGGIPDIVDDGVTGYLVPQRDAVALAEKLEILIKNPELRRKMGEAGRKKYEEQFTLEKFENRLVEILEDVLKKQ